MTQLATVLTPPPKDPMRRLAPVPTPSPDGQGPWLATALEPPRPTPARGPGRRQPVEATSDPFITDLASGSHPAATVALAWARGVAALSAGQPEAATAPLEEARAICAAAGLLAFALPFEADLIEACIRTGDLARAEELLAALESRGPGPDRTYATVVVCRSRALLAAARGDLEAALENSGAAVTAGAALAVPLEVARTWMVHGVVLRRLKRKRAAGEAIARALAIFDTLGAEAQRAQATAELDRVAPPPARPDALTPTEARIAELVAAGLRNADIASRLSIAVRTVEANLTRIYRKLGVQRRSDLVRHLLTAVPVT